MPRTLNRASQVYPLGTYGPFTIDGLGQFDNGFRATFTRESWPVGEVAEITAEISMDGSTWRPWFTCSLEGGESLDKNGQPLSHFAAYWPGENDGSGGRAVLRHVAARLSATVLQAFRTAITVEPI